MNKYLKEAEDSKDQLVSWRRDLHRFPETGTDLPKTVRYITEQLETMHIDYEIYEDCSCVVCTIGAGVHCVLLRSDMDGLAVKEATGLPYACLTGNMHACGHDLHTASLLGTAKLLKAHESELNGVVKLLFQSGEETFEGAKAAIDHGLMENPHVDAAYAAHIFAAQKMHSIEYSATPFSSVYGFQITVHGKGAHGAAPEMSIDPLSVGAHILLGLQELVAREVSAQEKIVLTVGHFEGGKAANVIPETAVLEGTLRTFDPKIREYLIRRIREVAVNTAATYRATAEIKTLGDCPAIVVDPHLAQLAEKAALKVVPDTEINNQKMVMLSEDFSFFSEMVPSVYFVMGGGLPDEKDWRSQHNPEILFNEDCIPVNAATYAQIAEDWLNEINTL